MSPPNRSIDSEPSLVVHETGRPPAPVLRYVDQIVGSPTTIEFRFSQGVLDAFDLDVVHVADPRVDHLLGTRGGTDWQRLFATLVLVRNLRRHRIALVRTLHPSTKQRRIGRGRRWAKRVLDRATTTFVLLDESTPTPDPARTTVIAHPHFRDRYVGYPRGEMVAGRLLCISAGALPVEAEHLLPVPRVSETESVTLRLVGIAPRPLDEPLRSAIVRHSSTVSARLEPVSEGALVQEIDAAELVVQPRVETMSDMQLVYLTLSLDRPVLVPQTPAMARLAAQVGTGWVHMSDGPITPRVIDEAFASIRRADRSVRPVLADRDVATTHAAYELAFRAAATLVQSRSRTRRTPRNVANIDEPSQRSRDPSPEPPAAKAREKRRRR